MLLSVALLLIFAGWLVATGMQKRDIRADPKMSVVGALLFGMQAIVGAVVVRGAMAMQQARNHSAAVKGAVPAIVPLNLMCWVAAPFGVWALVVLLNRRVRAGFLSEQVRWEWPN